MGGSQLRGLNGTFLSLLEPVEHSIDVEILDLVFYMLRGRSIYWTYRVSARVINVDEYSVGGFIAEERGDFGVDCAGGPR